MTVDRPRRAGWIELFFDLVFVAIVAQLARQLEGDPGAVDFGRFLLLFLPPWWSWLNFTTFVNVADGDRPRTRMSLLAAMACMGAMAVAVPDALGERADVYALGYIVSRAVSFALWLPVALSRDDGLTLARVAAFNGAGTALWIVSLFVPMPWQAVLWMAGVGCEVAVLAGAQRRGLERAYDVGHIVERVGLFVIIVLGESIVTSLDGLAEHWSGPGWVTLGFGFVLCAALWWGYFDHGSAIAARELSTGENARIRDVMGLGHFPVVAALIAMGAGLGTAVAEPHHLPFGAALAMCGGLVAYRLSFLLMSLRAHRLVSDALLRALLGVPIAVAVLAASASLPAWGVVALLAAEVVAQLLRGIASSRRTMSGSPEYQL
ncbi:low temperature requirement protein A [Nonomuraea lactucae]|uniref:low temperature requirement protein A n=1 Tax=Nonomuraea lactucae TaxID=2249762 RepID=UPI000DE2B84F|nr:low temperature requirement protein A [Nonomuraea lactucae]